MGDGGADGSGGGGAVPRWAGMVLAVLAALLACGVLAQLRRRSFLRRLAALEIMSAVQIDDIQPPGGVHGGVGGSGRGKVKQGAQTSHPLANFGADFDMLAHADYATPDAVKEGMSRGDSLRESMAAAEMQLSSLRKSEKTWTSSTDLRSRPEKLPRNSDKKPAVGRPAPKPGFERGVVTRRDGKALTAPDEQDAATMPAAPQSSKEGALSPSAEATPPAPATAGNARTRRDSWVEQGLVHVRQPGEAAYSC